MTAIIQKGKKIIDILEEMTSQTGDSLVTIFNLNMIVIDGNILATASSIDYSCQLRSLRATAYVGSLEVAPIPNYELTDTDSQKIMKSSFATWGEARKHLKIFKSKDNGPWRWIATHSFVNNGYPYSIAELMPYLTDSLAHSSSERISIGLQMENAGFGLLANDDVVTIHGCVIVDYEATIPLPETTNILEPSVVVTPLTPVE